ncbi:MAG: hypothetical protein DRG24_07345 [Epsilonproteobacteria bacterium]|nr:MAG: hypothetical protein DRG24_07345 [Campylobacterota bacterium]
MLRIVIFVTAALLLLFADGPVLKTGQTNSYDGLGNVVTDGSIKDDGYYRKGKPVDYTKGYDVVTDNATGLSWQDDESIIKTWVTSTNWHAGRYHDTSGNTATTYCNELTLFGAGWRLPTIQELKTLVDYGQYEPSTTPEVFSHIHEHQNDSAYWSSTSGATTTYEHLAWRVRFFGGAVGSGDKWSGQVYVRCVRGGPLASSSLNRNERAQVVTDWTTGLQWQDNSDVGSIRRNWIDALDYCEQLELDGDRDWRLPNSNELFSIIDYSRRPAINTSVFVNTNESSTSPAWTSTTSARDTEKAWWVYFGSGLVHSSGIKRLSAYVRCVRDGEGGSSGNNGLIPVVTTFLLN